MRKEDRIAVLAGLALFENCTRRELGDIASIMVESERPAGSLLTREGREGAVMFVLIEGVAEVVAGDSARDGSVIRHLRAGEVIGELSLIDGRTRSATVRAVTDVYLLEILHEDFQRLVKRSPKFVRNLLRALSLRVRATDALTS